MKSSLLLVLPFVLVMILISAGCSSDDQVPTPLAIPTETSGVPASENALPTATATPAAPESTTPAPTATTAPTEIPATPVPAPTPTPTREAIASFTVHDLEFEPKVGTVFETLLSKLPDNQATRGYTRLGDVAGVLDALGIEPLAPGYSTEDINQYSRQFSAPEYNGFYPPLWEWPAELRDYAGSRNTYLDLAFDFASVDQFARSDNNFLPLRDRSTPLKTYDVALGSFDPAATTAALAKCDCEQPEIREYNGIEYLAWSDGDGSGDLQRRLERPFYDHLGRGPHLLVRDGEAYYTPWDGVIDEHIDVIQGTSPSLAEVEDYVSAVRWIASMGIVSEITLRNQGFTVDEVVNRLLGQVTRAQVAQDSPLMSPFSMVATGTGYDGERLFTALVIVHEDATATEANRDVLLTRLREVTPARSTPDRALPWLYQADQVDIQSSGRFLVARIYFTQPPNTWLMNTPNSLLVHE